MNDVVIQAIGFVGVLFFIASYQIKSNRMLFLMQLIGTGLFCCQFLLLGRRPQRSHHPRLHPRIHLALWVEGHGEIRFRVLM